MSIPTEGLSVPAGRMDGETSVQPVRLCVCGCGFKAPKDRKYCYGHKYGTTWKQCGYQPCSQWFIPSRPEGLFCCNSHSVLARPNIGPHGANKCERCGVNDHPPNNGRGRHRYCQACSAVALRESRRRACSRWQRREYHERVANGQCGRCRAPSQRYSTCLECRRLDSARQKRKYDRRKEQAA